MSNAHSSHPPVVAEGPLALLVSRIVSVAFPLVTLLMWAGLLFYVVLVVGLGAAREALIGAVVVAIPLLLWSTLVGFLAYDAGFRRVCRLKLDADGYVEWQAAFRSGRFHLNDLSSVQGSPGPFRQMMRFRYAGGELRCYATLPGLDPLVRTIRARAPHVR